MPKKADIKEIFAANLKENRRKKGLTQEKLAESADISLRYLAMLELGKSFPSGEMLNKLAQALDIQAFQLFYPLATLDGALLHLEQSILSKIETVVNVPPKKDTGTINEPSAKEELQQLRQDIIQDILNAYNEKLERSIVFNIENVVKMSVKQAVASELKNYKNKK